MLDRLGMLDEPQSVDRPGADGGFDDHFGPARPGTDGCGTQTGDPDGLTRFEEHRRDHRNPRRREVEKVVLVAVPLDHGRGVEEIAHPSRPGQELLAAFRVVPGRPHDHQIGVFGGRIVPGHPPGVQSAGAQSADQTLVIAVAGVELTAGRQHDARVEHIWPG